MTLSTEAVIDEYGPALARLTASYERNRALREELLQEIFLALVSALPRLRDPSKLIGERWFVILYSFVSVVTVVPWFFGLRWYERRVLAERANCERLLQDQTLP